MTNPSLQLLLTHARERVLDRPAFARASASDQPPTTDQELCCDALVTEGARWLAKHKPDRRNAAFDGGVANKNRERFEKWLRRRVQRHKVTIASPTTYGMSCGVGLIMGALISWLIGRVIDFLWNWWMRNEKAPESCCAMVAGLDELDDEDDE